MKYALRKSRIHQISVLIINLSVNIMGCIESRSNEVTDEEREQKKAARKNIQLLQESLDGERMASNKKIKQRSNTN